MPITARACLLALCLLSLGCTGECGRAAAPVGFDRVADDALQAMKQRAEAMKATGAAMVAYIPGDATASWLSRMLVVGTFIKGDANVLAMVYTKAAEMADTFMDSGSGSRPLKKGENGYKGGVIRKVAGGYVLATFSGAASEDDVLIAQVGLQILGRAYDPQPAAR